MFENSQERKIALAMILSNYAKRNLEGVYDNFSNSDFGKKLKGMEKKNKYLLEFFLYLVSSAIDQSLDEKKFWLKFIKEIGIDAAPEIAKRFLNGQENPDLNRMVTELEKSFQFETTEKKALHSLLSKEKSKKSFTQKVESCLDDIIRNLKK